MSKRHRRRETIQRGWRHGPRYILAPARNPRVPPRPAYLWFIWDHAAGSYVAGPIANEASARERVRQLNAQAGYGAVTGPDPRRRPIPTWARTVRTVEGPPARQVRAAVVAVDDQVGRPAVTVRRPAGAAFPAVGATVVVYAPGRDPQLAELEALLPPPSGSGRRRPALVLRGITSADLPAGSAIAWVAP